MRVLANAMIVLFATPLAGCLGATVPDIREPTVDRNEELARENILLSQIRCEIHQGVQDTLDLLKEEGAGLGYSAEWLRTWVAKVNLKVSVDEKSALNPGVSLDTLLPNAVRQFPGTAGSPIVVGQSFSLGLGGQASTDATRTETVGMTYVLRDLLRNPLGQRCGHVGSVLIESDLKIGEFILAKASLARVVGNIQADRIRDPFDVFNYEVTFVVAYGGSITPTWRLIRVSADQGTTLFSASRTRTYDLTITMGPAAAKASGATIASDDVSANQLASLIGQAVARSLQAQQR